jgi:hypothetical protein
MGCKLPSGEEDDTVYSYILDEMYQGIFNSPSHTMTLNDWYRQARFWENRSFDQWSQSEGKYLYKEKKLQTRFTGSDMVNEDTVVYSDFADFHWAGKKIGDITGSITLTNIIDPTPKVWIRRYTEGEPWWFVGKINMSEITGTQATLNWSIPVYKSYFVPPVTNHFELYVLPNGSNDGLEIPISIKKTINKANTNVGSLGTVSIKGVTLSGTINVTYNGEPVPYVTILILRQAGSTLREIHLSSPGPDTAWSVVLEPVSYARNIYFQVYGFLDESENRRLVIDTYIYDNNPISAKGQDVPDIVLDLGNFPHE